HPRRADVAYKTIVVGTDGSESAERAVGHAIGLAVADQARLIVVTAFVRGDAAPDDSIPADVRWQVTDANTAEAHARRGRERAHDGDASDKLHETAEDFNADLMVVGSIGLTGATRLLGSAANTVLHHAPCDVLVVHTHEV